MQQRLGKMFLHGAFRNPEAFGRLGVTQPFDPIENEDLPGSLRQFGHRGAQAIQPLPSVGLVFLRRAIIGDARHLVDGSGVRFSPGLLSNMINGKVMSGSIEIGTAVQHGRAPVRILLGITQKRLLRQIRSRFRILQFVGEIGLQLPPMREEQPL